MYKFQAILGLISKIFSNVLLVICLPVSLLIFIASICMWQIEPLLNTIGASEVITDLSTTNLLSIISYVGLGVFIFMLFIFIVFIVAIVIKISLYKSISGFVIARNKELRNIEINKAQEKLDKYRYRE